MAVIGTKSDALVNAMWSRPRLLPLNWRNQEYPDRFQDPMGWCISNQLSWGDGERRVFAIFSCRSTFSFSRSRLMQTNSNTAGGATGGARGFVRYGFMNTIPRVGRTSV